jgi:hypothetical protein
MNLDTNPVNDKTYINDIRSSADFKGITFSGYKKTEVKNTLLNNMLKTKIEPACYWSGELICAGHFMDTWEIILYFVGKHIHLANPRLTIYLENRYQIFKNILNQSNFSNELQLRNNQNIRKLFAEILVILTYSPRRPAFEPVKINRQEEFDITQITERFQAPSIKYAEPLIQKEDPKELFVVLNEFSYSISKEGKSLLKACYWIEWLIEFDNICRKRREPCHIQRRTFPKVESKFQKDPIWILWDAIIHYAQTDGHGEFIVKTINSLLQLFCIKYTQASSKRRRYILYYAVELLTDSVSVNTEIISKDHKGILVSVLEQIHVIYKEIKKNEISPNTEYMFSALEKQQTMERTMKKLELLDSMGSFPQRNDFLEDDES